MAPKLLENVFFPLTIFSVCISVYRTLLPQLTKWLYNFQDVCWLSLAQLPLLVFFVFLLRNNLSRLVLSPTHINGNTSDLILTNTDELVHEITVHKQQVDSPIQTDPFIITFKLVSCPCPSNCESLVVFDSPKADWEGMGNHLLYTGSSMCFEFDDVELI